MMNKTRLITDADAVSVRLPSKSHNPQFAAPAWDTRFVLLLVKAGHDIASKIARQWTTVSDYFYNAGETEDVKYINDASRLLAGIAAEERSVMDTLLKTLIR